MCSQDCNTSKDSIYVFVYGTLKRGFGAHTLLKDAVFIGNARIAGVIYDGFYPMLKISDRAKEQRFVHGELFKIEDDKTLAKLDFYEGHPFLFVRKEVYCEVKEGVHYKYYKSWVYEYNDSLDDAKIVESGLWTR